MFSICTKKQVRTALLAFITVFVHTTAHSAPARNSNNNNYYLQENTQAINEVRTSLESIRHEMRNHESEIRMFDEKLNNLDAIIEGVRDQISDTSKAHKEQLKGSTENIEDKISNLETATKGLVADLRLFKAHANETTSSLAQYKQKIAELEKIVDLQNQNIEHLQAAMRSIMDALQPNEPAPSKNIVTTPTASSSNNITSPSANTSINSDRAYRIKPGDSLEKIARNNNTTVQALKELNGLTNDRIVVGKILQLPEK